MSAAWQPVGEDGPVTERPTLDHVAHAVEARSLILDRYARCLGGRYVGHGDATGFSPLQLRYGNGGKVELLQPNAVDRNPFLRRFLDRRGPGLHHATFKVPDIRATIRTVEQAGYAVVDVDLTHADWQEAFIHPKSAQGFLVQLAQSEGGMPADPPPEFPAPAQTARLVRVVLLVAALEHAVTLYRDVLGGVAVAAGGWSGEGTWVDLDHGGGCLLRVVEPDDPADLGGTPGRADHLVFRVEDPTLVDGAVEGPDGWEVPAASNHGARLVLET
jgi:catechol 2,3-dioxygenase-like lactoylglutathione lyase family enzyme